MAEFIDKDTDSNDYIKYTISKYKGMPAADINILGATVNPDDEPGTINLRYSYNGVEDTVSILRQPLQTIRTFRPDRGQTYNVQNGVWASENINDWNIVKNSKTICDILDIASDMVNVKITAINILYTGVSIYIKISAKEDSYYLWSEIDVMLRYPYTASIADAENIHNFMPKMFRHDYVDEYIKLYDTYPDGVPPEKLLELENAKIQAAGRESYFIRGEEYNPNKGEDYYKHDESNLIGTLFENHILGTKTGRDIYDVAASEYGIRDWRYKGEAGYSMLVAIRTDGSIEGGAGTIIARHFDMKRDIVPVMPKKGFKRAYTNDKSVRDSKVSGTKGSYYIDSIVHLGTSKFKLRLDQAYRRLVYYSGIQRKDSYSEEELASLKSKLKLSIENQLYNVYNLPINRVKLNMDVFEKNNNNIVIVKVSDSTTIVNEEIPIDIIYEK